MCVSGEANRSICKSLQSSGWFNFKRHCGGQKEVWSPTKQLEHLQHHGEPHQGKQQGLGHPVRGFRTRDSSTTGVHHFSSNREPQLQAVRDNQQLPHKREQRPQYSLSRGDEQMLNAEPPKPRQNKLLRTEAQWDCE